MADYFDMLHAKLSGVTYSKAEHRRRLQRRFTTRSHASIEFKHATSAPCWSRWA